ncbi:hypothetical protein CB0940_08618 [Cercospora beticola]|uniref:Terpene synthase n=1 Tax=Cercospora beticola TaxID=122368 RepID=A0A2G5HNT3_CERBT|nr:hypothetical protein CB0940_08618 [Cercospora beticola]PIA94211.1 hypothetical protein CB0940_08618 [Cercospora beticola]WPB05197.1 hypothetical protein RHO25_009848 [Cercospora beticola]
MPPTGPGDAVSNSPQVLQKQAVIAQIQGQPVTIPPLETFLPPGWPLHKNQHYAASKPIIEKWITEVVAGSKRQVGTIMADMTGLAAYFYPLIDDLEVFIALVKFVHWIFFFDDRLDDGDLVHHTKLAKQYREDTSRLCAQCFLPEVHGVPNRTEWLNVNWIEEIAAVITPLLAFELLTDHREALVDEIDHYINACDLEQRYRNSDDLPSVQDFMTFRYNSGACGLVFATGLPLMTTNLSAKDLQLAGEISWLANWLVLYPNELISLKKELASGQLENLVPTPAASEGPQCDLQSAINRTTRQIQAAGIELDLAESKLLATLDHANASQEKTAEFSKLAFIYKSLILGNLKWHYESARYGVAADSKEIGGAISYIVQVGDM